MPRINPRGRLARLLFPILFLTASVIVFGQNPARGGTATITYLMEPRTFDPTLFDDSAVPFSNLLFNALVIVNERLELAPCLAESWEVSQNGLEWKFHLRKNVLCHDGIELTAEDVVATYSAILGPGFNSPGRESYRIIRGLRSDDRYTFIVELKEPFGPLLDMMKVGIVPARFLRDEQYMKTKFFERPIGTGPFKFEKRVPGELSFTAFDKYFEGRPYLDFVVLKLYHDQKKAWVSLMQGDIDSVSDLAYEDYVVTHKDSRFKTFEMLDNFNYQLLFNQKDPLFSQKNIRQVIAAAIDRQDIIEKSFPAGGVPSTGPFRPGTWPYNPDASSQKFDPQKAKKMLADLGWKDTDGDWILEKGKEKLSFAILIDKGDPMKEITVKRIQWQLMQVGIRTDVEALPPDEFYQKRFFSGKFQAILIQTNTFGDPDLPASKFWHSSSIGKSNFGSYNNPEVDRLIEEGRRTSSQSDRAKVYHKIHDIIASDAPAVFLFYKNRFVAISGRIGGINSGFYLLNTSYMNKWYIDNGN